MREIGLFAVVLAAAGCTTPDARIDTWPPHLPDVQYYCRSYEKDPANRKIQTLEEYLGWVQCFYGGYGFAAGWSTYEAEIEKSLTDEERELQWPRVKQMGMVISAEWAKDNSTRKIDLNMLPVWGRTLQRAAQIHQLKDTLDRIEADVRDLIAGTLERKAITLKRYGLVVAQK